MKPLRLLLACACCAAACACESPRTQLDAHQLGVAAQQLESIAAEAQWLAEQLQSRNVTASFAWVDQQALGEDAGKAAHGALKPAPSALREPQEQLSMLAARLQLQLPRIAPAAGQAAELAELGREFRRIAAALHPLAQRA